LPILANLTALEVASRYSAAISDGDNDQMTSLRSADFVMDFVHTDAEAADPPSAETARTFWTTWLSAFPEYDWHVTRTVAADEVVVTQWVFSGTHEATIEQPIFDPPLEATGRTISIRGVSFYDIKDGLIERETLYIDLATLIVELGAEL
jgi:steroid delta-isomerase-like uncharacterized protein